MYIVYKRIYVKKHIVASIAVYVTRYIGVCYTACGFETPLFLRPPIGYATIPFTVFYNGIPHLAGINRSPGISLFIEDKPGDRDCPVF